MTTVFDQLDLTGTVGFVTGAGSGLGRAYAEGLSEAGAAVACVDINDDAASETAAGLETEAIVIEADVTSETAVASAVEKTVDELGGLNAAFANAGIGGAMAPLNEHPLDEWQSVIDVNLTGVFLTAREAAHQMIDEGEGGKIVSTASIYGFVGSFAGTSTAYTAAKGGVVNLTREMAVSLAPYGIHVNAIAPGFVGTTLLDEGLADISESEAEEFKTEIQERTLLGRLADPDEMKAMAVYLASPASSYVTGQTMTIDGGWLTR